MITEKPVSVDAYIASFPKGIQAVLRKVRATIKQAAPQAGEGISYAMPAYKTHGKYLVYFAGYKQHIGFYATPTGHEAFKEELSNYKQGKGSVQFQLNQEIPYDLISRIVEFRVQENTEKVKSKKA